MSNRNAKLLAIFIFTSVFLSLVIMFFVYKATEDKPDENVEEYDSTIVTPSPLPTPDPNWKLPTGWSEYKSNNLGVSLLYLGDKKPMEKDKNLYFILPGPSQLVEADFYDGIRITIIKGTIGKPNVSLRESLNPIYELRKTDSSVKKISQIEDYSLNGVSGYKFTETIENGKNIRIYLSKGGSEYLVIYFSVLDPNNRGLELTGQKIIDSIKYL